MATIKVKKSWGANAGVLIKDSSHPLLRDVLDNMQNDITRKTPAVIASPDASDDASTYLLVNEIKAALNTARAVSFSVVFE